MRLAHLLDGISAYELDGCGAPEAVDIKGLAVDSRYCQPGELFAALKGTVVDGTSFVPDVISKGAAAVLTHKDYTLPEAFRGRVCVIRCENPREVLGFIAARYYKKQPSYMAAVTGTNGKTSVAHFTRQLWYFLGLRSASMGTIGIYTGMNEVWGKHSHSLTTPDVITLHKTMKKLVEQEVQHVIIEASSHGLDQRRLSGISFKVAAFTNLSRDHMDYHNTEEEYFYAKKRLFAEVLPTEGTAVLNADSDYYAALVQVCKKRGIKIISYGRKGEDIQLLSMLPTTAGQQVQFRVGAEEYEIFLNLIGEFQVKNLLCSLGIVMAEGIAQEKVLEVMEKVTAVPGRMQLVGKHPSGAPVLIDYAHTPEALEKVLKAVRPHAMGDIVVVFGCGGDRDKGKRPIMGKIADTFADTVIITDDNPRTENADDIRYQILAACDKGREIGNRAEAIRTAICDLRSGDILVIAGKGHERYQIIGNKKYTFDDAKVAGDILKELA